MISVTKKLRPHWSVINATRWSIKFLTNFRNEKVTAPLKLCVGFLADLHLPNFRNEKVTAPLKHSLLYHEYNTKKTNFRNEKVTAPLKRISQVSIWQVCIFQYFRNEKVTAPLKHPWDVVSCCPSCNFRNEKVTAPLKRIYICTLIILC